MITLDGQNTSENGYADPTLYQQLLFAKDELSLKVDHRIILQNNYTTPNSSSVDLDWITITSGNGNTA